MTAPCVALDNCSCIVLPSPRVNCAKVNAACGREGTLGCVHGLVPPASDPHGCGKCGRLYGTISAVQSKRESTKTTPVIPAEAGIHGYRVVPGMTFYYLVEIRHDTIEQVGQ